MVWLGLVSSASDASSSRQTPEPNSGYELPADSQAMREAMTELLADLSAERARSQALEAELHAACSRIRFLELHIAELHGFAAAPTGATWPWALQAAAVPPGPAPAGAPCESPAAAGPAQAQAFDPTAPNVGAVASVSEGYHATEPVLAEMDTAAVEFEPRVPLPRGE